MFNTQSVTIENEIVKEVPPKTKGKKERKSKEDRKKKKSKKDVGATTVQEDNGLMGLVDLEDTPQTQAVQQSTFKQLGEDDCMSMVSLMCQLFLNTTDSIIITVIIFPLFRNMTLDLIQCTTIK